MNMEIKSIPTTKNEGWGFWGTISNDSGRCNMIEWASAFLWIRENVGDIDRKPVTDDEIRGFLDSQAGRHIADQMHGNGLSFAQALVQCGRNRVPAEALFVTWGFARTIREFRVNPW